MQTSLVSIVTPAPTHDLTTLATLKEELGITANTYDAQLARWIREESGNIERFCARTFAQETVQEIFRFDVSQFYYALGTVSRDAAPAALVLRRTPVQSITSITEDSVTLTAADFEFEVESGLLYRLDGNGNAAAWTGAAVTVVYVAGYQLLDSLPFPIEKCCLTLLRYRWLSRFREPGLRTLIVPGVVEQQWWQQNPAAETGFRGMPVDVAGQLESFRNDVL